MELGTPLKASVGADAFLFYAQARIWKFAADAAAGRAASGEDGSSLLDYAQARIWKFAADATCGASGEDALTYLILYVYNNMNCQKVQDLF